MKQIIFDAGPLISLTTNNLLWIIKELSKKYKGKFVITEAVKRELVDKPLSTKKYKFEALQFIPYITSNTINLKTNVKGLKKRTEILSKLGNSIFEAKGKTIKIVHDGELESLALYSLEGADALIMDERVTRMLIEEPKRLGKRLREKLHTNIIVKEDKLNKFKEQLGNINIIRSVELVTIAFEMGLLKRYIPNSSKIYVKNLRKTLIEAILWGVKLNGCAVSQDEITEIVKIEKSRKLK